MDESLEPTLIESRRDPASAVLNEVVAAGEPWIGMVCRGQTFRIVDLEGNQAVDTLFFNAANSDGTLQRSGHHSRRKAAVSHDRHATAVERWQRDAHDHRRYLRPARHARRRLLSRKQHGALRAREAPHAQLPRQLPARARALGTAALTKRDLPSNINFFMNVPVTPAGELTFADGISAAGPLRGDARRDGRDRADLQLPAAQQSVQCL